MSPTATGFRRANGFRMWFVKPWMAAQHSFSSGKSSWTKLILWEIQKLCREYDVPFVINDNVKIAAEIGADGVHVGQSDMEAGNVREILGDKRIIGVSAGTVEEAKQAEARGADYLGVGAIFPTDSKDDARALTMDTLKAITAAVNIPVVAIGGITEENTLDLAGTGIDGVAVISAIFGQKDIETAARRLLTVTKHIVNK